MALYHFDTDDEKRDFWFLLQALNVIIRIINSWKEKVDLEKFGPYVRETHKKMHDMFPEIWDNGKISLFNNISLFNFSFMKKMLRQK